MAVCHYVFPSALPVRYSEIVKSSSDSTVQPTITSRLSRKELIISLLKLVVHMSGADRFPSNYPHSRLLKNCLDYSSDAGIYRQRFSSLFVTLLSPNNCTGDLRLTNELIIFLQKIVTNRKLAWLDIHWNYKASSFFKRKHNCTWLVTER